MDFILPDLLAPQLNVVFCGTAPSITSAKERAYYARPGNRFWPILYEIGLTPYRIAPFEYPTLLQYRIGLTDLCKMSFGEDKLLTFQDEDKLNLKEKILSFSPRILAFTSKYGAQNFLNKKVPFGRLEEKLGTTEIFVLPSTSGRATWNWDPRYWYDLARWVRSFL